MKKISINFGDRNIKINKKIVFSFIAAIALCFIIKIGYACTYVGDILVIYPWDNYTVSEKIANYLCGYGKGYTKQELYDKGLISGDSTMIRKFSSDHYK